MSIAAVMMARAMGMQYYGMGNAYCNMDSKMALANSVNFGSSTNSDYKNLANKDKAYDISLQKSALEYKAGNAMYNQAKVLEKEWANSFNVFA